MSVFDGLPEMCTSVQITGDDRRTKQDLVKEVLL